MASTPDRRHRTGQAFLAFKLFCLEDRTCSAKFDNDAVGRRVDEQGNTARVEKSANPWRADW